MQRYDELPSLKVALPDGKPFDLVLREVTDQHVAQFYVIAVHLLECHLLKTILERKRKRKRERASDYTLLTVRSHAARISLPMDRLFYP